MSTIAPIWTAGDDPEERWTLGEIMAVLAVCHIDHADAMHVLAVLRGMRDRD